MFLDVDGTLLKIAASPTSVYVSTELKDLLITSARQRAGALALVSGRSLSDLDELFAPLVLPAAGQHGLERRDAQGRVFRASGSTALLDTARAELRAWVGEHPGLLLEDKGSALALHYRLAPEWGEAARIRVQSYVPALPGFHVQPGKCVWELKPAAVSKGSAICTFMSEPPFANRVPVCIGDDVTDEDGFKAVNALGGISIRVGTEDAITAARFRLSTVQDVIDWLSHSQHAH